jgi:hypothetical protein
MPPAKSGGEDDARHLRVGERAADMRVELADARLGEHVHPRVGQVPGDDRDAVGVGLVVEDLAHRVLTRAAFRRAG